MAISDELKKRLLIGIPGVALLVLLPLFGGWWGAYLISVVVGLAMLTEFALMTFSLKDRVQKISLLLILAFICQIAFMLSPGTQFLIYSLVVVILAIYFLVTANRYDQNNLKLHFQELALGTFGFFYFILLMFYLPLIRNLSYGIHWVLVFFLIIWSGDTGAYFIGSRYGKTKLYPLISPKKSIEGAVGGLCLACLVISGYRLLFFPEMDLVASIVITVAVSIIAQCGDLVASMIKRAYDAKDSGQILPGHGGFLDRFDALVLGLPVMYVSIKILG